MHQGMNEIMSFYFPSPSDMKPAIYHISSKVVRVSADQTGGVENPPCIKIGYSEPRGAESREGSSTRGRERLGFFGTVILDSDWLTKF